MAAQQKLQGGTRRDTQQYRPDTLPRLSVIIGTYNRRSLLLSTLASLRQQTLSYTQFEVIVVDNGSSDDTLYAVSSYVSAGRQNRGTPEAYWRVHCLSEPRRGLAYARNAGLAAACGDIAVFLDDDSVVASQCLEQLLQAYQETGTDAIAGRVELDWEAPRPHWLGNDLLGMMGHFVPSNTRQQLQPFTTFSHSNFSVKMEVLRHIGYFSPLSTRPQVQTGIEIHDLSFRLYQAGYTLWYEPNAAVVHRIHADLLRRSYFLSRAYWQGRTDVLAQYTDQNAHVSPWQSIVSDLHEIAYLALIHRPLLHFAHRPMDEHLFAAIAQARHWGYVQQRLHLLWHAPQDVTHLAVLLVRPAASDPAVTLLARSLGQHEAHCTTAIAKIPLSWLWYHRAYKGHTVGILHIFRPGAFALTVQQRRTFLLRLWLARRWGIRVITSDVGGWWQSTSSFRFLAQRRLEHATLSRSDVILSHTRQPEQLYPDRKIYEHVHCVAHPGFRGYYGNLPSRSEARIQIGISATTSFVYLCFAHEHTEQELIYLIKAFGEIQNRQQSLPHVEQAETQLVIAGSPIEEKTEERLLKLAALNAAIHLSLTALDEKSIAWYLAATDAVVLPHRAIQTAGILEIALIAISHGRSVIAPNLPRFRGILPPHASILYDPANRESLIQALIEGQRLTYHMNQQEITSFDVEYGWDRYTQRVLKIYRQIVGNDSNDR